MKQHHKHRQKQGGFTLVELIVVIAIIGILAALVVPSVSGYVQKAQATTCQRNIQNAAQMLDQVVAQDMGAYSDEAKLNELLKNIMENNGDYFNKPVKCPSGGTYEYKAYWAPNGSLRCTITCSKHAGIEGSKTVAQKVDKTSSVYMDEVLDLFNKPSRTEEETERLKELLANPRGLVNYLSNSNIRTRMLEEFGGEWPELEAEIAANTTVSKKDKLYVQPYISVKNGKYGGTLIYASMSSGKSGRQPWEAYAIYNPNDNKWYKPVAGNTYTEGKQTYNVDRLYKEAHEDTVESILASLNDTTQWTPIN